VATKYILALLGAAFLVAAIARVAQGGGLSHPQTRTWLLIAVIFAGVSGWLFHRT
jgi:predicted benzoate:H+ symporter BenE